MKRQDYLAEIVLTAHAIGRLTNATDRREHKSYCDNNNADDDKDFDKLESVAC
jgi:hypothetical protein